MIDRKMAETATDQNAPCLFKDVADVFRGMGIRTESNVFSAQLSVTSEDIFRRIGMPQAIFESGSITFQRFAFFDQRPENRINIILIVVIGIILVCGGTIADHIVQVSEGVKAIQILDPPESHFKIPFIGAALGSSFKKGGVIGIHPVNKMAGTDDIIHIEGAGKRIQIIPDMALQPQLYANGDPDAVFIFLAQAVKPGQISRKVQKENFLFHAGIVIMVIRDADFLHTYGDTALDLYRCRGGAVSGKCSMYMSVGEHKMQDLLNRMITIEL